METNFAAHCFAVLGNPGRLDVFRLLMRFAPRSVRPTEIAQALNLKPNTLSHYLNEMLTAGLIVVTRRGRSLYYAPNMARLNDLIDFVAHDLARGRSDLLPSAPPPHVAGRPAVLFLCTGNSARSLMAESLLRSLGGDRFAVFSAGTHPQKAPNPLALEVLRRNGHDITPLWSKSVAEYQSPDAPRFDFVFSLCDAAVIEDCGAFPESPITAHWGIDDPAAVTGTEAERMLAFSRAYSQLRRRIEAFLALPLQTLGRPALQREMDAVYIQPFI